MESIRDYDIAVIGAGFAGCEAAMAAAGMGLSTAIFTMSLDGIANMACNPSIGGTAKGQLVREIDALGGIMGQAADATCVQIKMLNRAKGPAVYSPRAQSDRRRYQMYMKHALELKENLDVKQGEIVEILTEPDDSGKRHVTGVVTHLGAVYGCKCAVVCTGTYLKGRVVIGDIGYSSGPDGQFPANKLSECLSKLGFTLIRFKTGTPARVNRRSVDLSQMEIQEGDNEPFCFSFDGVPKFKDSSTQLPCYLAHTNSVTHDIIKANLDRSPLFNGMIEGVGPRYCPSIESKIVRFNDKDKHQLFVEPMGEDTEEMYLQGLSSSLPETVQLEFIRSIKGLENVSVMRPAYAIEYDAIDARELKLSLESRIVDGIFCAGQINGSSGYEEAAAQGIMAGINSACKLKGIEPLIIKRYEGYIGVLIDDLVTRGTQEPYRMMTSRAEYRLLLRHDNSDFRLTEKGYRLGLISQERYDRFLLKYEHINREIERLNSTFIGINSNINSYLEKHDSTPLKSGCSLAELLRRPELTYADVLVLEGLYKGNNTALTLTAAEEEQVEIMTKYEGYLKRQEVQIEQFKKQESKSIPDDIDFNAIPNLCMESREKLSLIRPESIGQAERITGVSPADIAALLVYIRGRKNG